MVANLLSVLRILLLPPALYSLYQDGESASPATLILLALAAASDLADGYLARRFHQVSRLGMILDPLADKIFLGGMGIALVLWRDFPFWLLAVLLVRDFGILLAGLFLLRSRGLVVPANRFGKYTTVCMTLAALSYLVPAPAPLRGGLIYLTALMLFVSSLSYALLMRQTLSDVSPEKPS